MREKGERKTRRRKGKKFVASNGGKGTDDEARVENAYHRARRYFSRVVINPSSLSREPRELYRLTSSPSVARLYRPSSCCETRRRAVSGTFRPREKHPLRSFVGGKSAKKGGESDAREDPRDCGVIKNIF